MRQTQKNYLKIGVILLSFAFFFTNCQKEDDLSFDPIETSKQTNKVFYRLLEVAKTKQQEYNKTINHLKDGYEKDTKREKYSFFETKYGTPLFSRSIGLTKEDGTPILVTPLIDNQGNVAKLLFGFIENGEEKYRVVDKSAKEGSALIISDGNQERIYSPQTKIGPRQLGGLFKMAELHSKNLGANNKDSGLSCSEVLEIELASAAIFYGTNCLTVSGGESNGSGCSGFVITPCNLNEELANVEGSSGGGSSSDSGSTGTPNPTGPAGNTPGGGSTGNNNNTNDNDAPGNGGIIGEDPFIVCSNPPASLISELENVFGIGNFEIDCNTDTSSISQELHFKNEEELQEFWTAYQLSKENVTATNETTVQITPNGPEVVEHFKFYQLPYTIYNFYIKQKLGLDYMYFSDYSVLEVNSELSGATLFDDWVQVSYYNHLDSYNSITNVYGITSLKIVFKELVVPISAAYHFRMTTNATDGSAISQEWVD